MQRRHSPGKPVSDEVDQWRDRIQLVDEGDEEVGRFLDSLDLRGPQEREMLAELARKTPLAKPGRPPRDQSRKFAIVGIVLTTLTWFVFPAVIAIAVLT